MTSTGEIALNPDKILLGPSRHYLSLRSTAYEDTTSTAIGPLNTAANVGINSVNIATKSYLKSKNKKRAMG